MSSAPACETWAVTGRGRLYVKQWFAGNVADVHRDPIVLMHDSLGCVALWREFPHRLADATGRDVIAYDRLGFGQSDPHPGRLDCRFVHTEAGDGFVAVREALGLERFLVFGHSVGGGMGIAIAAMHADACIALITESAQAFREDRTVEGILAARRSFEAAGQVDRLRRYHGEKASWVLGAWIDTWLADDFVDWNLDDDLRRVRCPVLAMHGDGDEYGSSAHPQRIAALTALRSEQMILPGCGHVPHREQADVVLSRVSDWLNRIGD